MLKELICVLFCIGFSSMWGYKIYESIKNKSKFDIIYCSITTCIFVAMSILKVIEILISYVN